MGKLITRRWIDRVFKREEMDGHGRCPAYLIRWELFRCRWFAVYLHHFVGDDWCKDLHDHPRRFLSIGLYGQYIETTAAGDRTYRAPWVRTFPANHAHRLRLIDGRDCWTMVAVFKRVREWGFWHDGRWFNWREYVPSKMADRMKNCPD